MKKVLSIAALFWLILGGTALAQNYSSDGPLTSNATTIAAGDEVTVSGGGFAAGSSVTVFLISGGAETELGSGEADADGNISIGITMPADFDGNGSIVARGQGADGAAFELRLEIVDGRVAELPFTGSSSRTRWLVGFGVAAVVAGGAMLGLRDWQTTR